MVQYASELAGALYITWQCEQVFGAVRGSTNQCAEQFKVGKKMLSAAIVRLGLHFHVF